MNLDGAVPGCSAIGLGYDIYPIYPALSDSSKII